MGSVDGCLGDALTPLTLRYLWCYIKRTAGDAPPPPPYRRSKACRPATVGTRDVGSQWCNRLPHKIPEKGGEEATPRDVFRRLHMT